MNASGEHSKKENGQSLCPEDARHIFMEIFAGAALLTTIASSMGYAVSTPVDLVLDGSNILDPKVQSELDVKKLPDMILTSSPLLRSVVHGVPGSM